MFGNSSDTFGCEDSGVEYTNYFNSNAKRIKYDNNNNAIFWWLRTAGNTPGGYGRGVNTTGGRTGGSKYNERLSVVFGFCT